MSRPENHVTRELAQRQASRNPAVTPLPDIPEALLKALEARYPPRCLGPRETVEDHLRYAGASDLVAYLRAEFEEGRKVGLDASDLEADPEAIMRSGERAI